MKRIRLALLQSCEQNEILEAMNSIENFLVGRSMSEEEAMSIRSSLALLASLKASFDVLRDNRADPLDGASLFDATTSSQEEEKQPPVPETNETSPKDPSAQPAEKPRRRGKGSPKPKPSEILHPLPEDKKTCTECGKAMHKAHCRVRSIIQLVSMRLEKHLVETARCLTCDTKVEAEGPKQKTIGRFSLEAGSFCIAMRYIFGMPSKRMEQVTELLGYRVSDSSQWNLFSRVAKILHPFYLFLKNEASQAGVASFDDTNVKIIELRGKVLEGLQDILRRQGSKENRTGVHTTATRAQVKGGVICLFDSGLHHGGEVFERLMRGRTCQDQVITMTDALAANSSRLGKVAVPVVEANCNSHALRKFKEVRDNPVFTRDADEMLVRYRMIFNLEGELKGVSAQERLRRHREESLPLMEWMKKRAEEVEISQEIEPSSGLGKAFSYFRNRYEQLTAFCREEGAPVCNNATERVLKRVIRHRRNSQYFRTLEGAAVGDLFWTILVTAIENGLNPTDYLSQLLENPEDWEKSPEDWLPWNFEATKERLETGRRRHSRLFEMTA